MNSNQPMDRRNGSGKIFVLVHGGAQGAWAFGKVAWPLIRDGHQVIARDLPGHGLRARFPFPTWNGPRIRIASRPSRRPLPS
jgi:alpha-beta hydrolase superfamily lysophospholipase